MIQDLRDYFPLRDLATQALTVADLIHLGATGRLPIYVLADGWHVEVWKQSMKEVDPRDPMYAAGITAVPEGEPFKASDISSIVAPVRLIPETLARLEANPSATEHRFLVTPNDAAPEYVSEFRLVGGVDGKQQPPVDLANCTLVVMRRDLPLLEELIQGIPPYDGLADPDYQPPKRKAPDAFVAALIRLLAETAKRAGAKGLKFDVSEMPGQKEDLLAVAKKFDGKNFNKSLSTFDTYISGLCRFGQGAGHSSFYAELFKDDANPSKE